ncbi:MAG: sodium:solute symporter family protein [Archaeoglobus sp.]|nr:sodium:solute symporter family protein [Archaeoglobus sp.]
MANIEVLMAILIYSLAIILAGIVFVRKWATRESSLIVCGREVGAFVTAAAQVSICVSGGFLPLLIAYSYVFGFGGVWIWWAWGIMTLAYPFVIGIFSRRSGAYTPAEAIEAFHGTSSRVIVGALLVYSLFFLTAIQYVGVGSVLSGFFGIDRNLGILLVGILMSLYIATGGLWSVTVTDVLQIIFATVGILGLVIYFVSTFGWDYLFTGPHPISPQKLVIGIGTIPFFGWKSPAVMSMLMFNLLLVWGGAYYWQRGAAVRSEKTLKLGFIAGGIAAIILAVLGAIIGLYGYVLLGPGLKGVGVLGNILTKVGIPWLVGLMLVALFAATMSTADATTMGMATVVWNDFIKKFKKIPEDKAMRNIRVIVLVLSAIAILLAIFAPYQAVRFYVFGTMLYSPILLLLIDAAYLRILTEKLALILLIVPTVIGLIVQFSYISKTVDPTWLTIVVAVIIYVIVYIGRKV